MVDQVFRILHAVALVTAGSGCVPKSPSEPVPLSANTPFRNTKFAQALPANSEYLGAEVRSPCEGFWGRLLIWLPEGEMTQVRFGSIGCGGLGLFVFACGLLAAPSGSAQDSSRCFEEVRRFSADEATQGVAVDERHFYAISNRRIGKYDKESGARVGGWEGA